MTSTAAADAGASVRSKLLAVAVALSLLAGSLLSIRLGGLQGPHLPAFISIVATLWCAADLLTAFLLYVNFRVTGTVGFLAIACAYCVTGVLTMPYLLAFPNIFFFGKQLQQVSITLWLIWHVLFPLIVGTCLWVDPLLRGRWIDQGTVKELGNRVLGGVALAAAALGCAVWSLHAQLPRWVETGRFLPAYTHAAAPLVTTLNLFVCASIVARVRRPSALHVWLAVALFATGLDGALNTFSTSRYTFSWYVGKVETLITATVLLGVLLSEVESLYSRIANFALLDPLTGLRNRRSFDDAAQFVFGVSRRKGLSVAVLMIDVDYFKRFNDTFGHGVGDATVRPVEGALRKTRRSGAQRGFCFPPDLKGDFVDTSRDGFGIALDISAYSLVAVWRAARPLMTEGGSIITMTYYGAEKVVPKYNLMGVAKAALKA